MEKAKYRTFRTTMGHKVRVRMTEEEVEARSIFRVTVVMLPLLSFVLFAAAWLGRW